MSNYNSKILKEGLFITLEGPDCAGKSTQQRLLSEYLTELSYDVLTTREPGGTKIGEELRNLVKHVCGDDAPCDEAELFMFSASRAQLTRKVILPHLEKGGVVICDRYADSTTVYQGYARGLSLDGIHQVHAIAVGERWPDITFLIDLDPEIGRRRNAARSETLEAGDRFEAEALAFHTKVRNGFLDLAKHHPERFIIIDGNRDIDAIQTDLREHIAHALERLR